jgi:hypothetical protein
MQSVLLIRDMIRLNACFYRVREHQLHEGSFGMSVGFKSAIRIILKSLSDVRPESPRSPICVVLIFLNLKHSIPNDMDFSIADILVDEIGDLSSLSGILVILNNYMLRHKAYRT